MNWYDTNEKPERNRDILVLYNKEVLDGKKPTTYTGIFMGEDVLDRHYWLFTANGSVNYIPVYNIQGWMYTADFIHYSKRFLNKQDVVIHCPYCGQETLVYAQAVDTDWVDMPVVKYKGDVFLHLDWDNIDAQCGFNYICNDCKEVLAQDMESLQEFVNKHKVRKD